MSLRARRPSTFLSGLALSIAVTLAPGCPAPRPAPEPVVVAISPATPQRARPAPPLPPAPSKPPPAGAAIRWEDDEPGARERALRDGRPLLVYLRADWDAASLRMEREVWSDPRVVAAARPFVTLRLDLSSAEGDAELYAQRYGVAELPAVALFDDHGARVALLLGSQRVEALVEAMREAAE